MVQRKSSASRRRPRGVPVPVVLGGFCLVGIIGGLATRAVMKQNASSMAAQTIVVGEFDTVKVMVPARTIASGERLRDVPMLTIDFPKHQLPQGTLTSIDEYLGARAKTALPANVPLTLQNLAMSNDTTNAVIQRIPPGMRAMTVKVDATSAVEGWATSGSIVDVLLIAEEETTVIAEQVRVLSAERKTDPQEVSLPSVPTTITLLVTQAQCLAINTAIAHGKLAFALRSQDDEHGWSNPQFKAKNLKHSADSDSANGTTGIAKIKGAKGTNETFTLINNKWQKVTVPKPMEEADSNENIESAPPAQSKDRP